jgi:hypothetical protein
MKNIGTAPEIVRLSLDRASASAVRIWAMASAQYPERHGELCARLQATVVDDVSTFAVNGRRVIEWLGNTKFQLVQRRWDWGHDNNPDEVSELKQALDRVLHARSLNVALVRLPLDQSVISGGAVVIPFLEIGTDWRTPALVDLFAMAHSFLYDVAPLARATSGEQPGTTE